MQKHSDGLKNPLNKDALRDNTDWETVIITVME